jgi:hypothetical protein
MRRRIPTSRPPRLHKPSVSHSTKVPSLLVLNRAFRDRRPWVLDRI